MRRCFGFIWLSVAIFVSDLTRASEFANRISDAAIDRIAETVRYDGSYVALAYPGGDVPAEIGVCTDVVIRVYRAIGTDLQVLVHEDMQKNFAAYPSNRIWGLKRPDRNIDHRRVPNLRAFFSRHGDELNVTNDPNEYTAGDIVTWMVAGKLPHIGIVTSQRSAHSGNPLVVHNIGAGPKLEDMLFDHRITGHYRYVPQTFQPE